MSLADLTKKIVDEAESQAKNIQSAAREEIEKISRATDEKLQAITVSHEASLKRTLASNKERVLASAHQEIQSLRDKEKRALLDEMYKKALEKVAGDEQAIEKILSPHVAAIKNETGVAHVAPDHQKVLSKLAKKYGGQFEIKADKNISGGFRFEGEKTEYDATLETLIARVKDAVEPEIAATLFS